MKPHASHPCPNHATLKRYAHGNVDHDVESHLAECGYCHAAVQAIEAQDLAFDDTEPESTFEPIDVTNLPPEVFTHPVTLDRQREAAAEHAHLTLVA